ncbi:MAG: TIGR03790 family protein [Planctomycetota bacterium]|nr:TIGR03790 family protein [Planctomycetota bacterium]RLS38462.1 MAG: TIGR03790 family protein [Planctomycetota bacterium]
MRLALFCSLIAAAFGFCPAAFALDPAEVVVIANKSVPDSIEVAEHYLAKRQVPRGNLILLDLPKGEDMTRKEYDEKLAGPLREALQARKKQVKVLLTVYGVPLRVGGQEQTPEEKAGFDLLTPRLEVIRKEIAELEKNKTAPGSADRIKAAQAALAPLQQQQARFTHPESHACVDSELMMLWVGKYPLERFLPNPMHWQFPASKRQPGKIFLMTARLDGPSKDIAKRLVDDAVAVEQAGGLQGKAYIDARGLAYKADKPGETGTGLEGYDESYREAAAVLKKAGIETVLDDKPEIFKADSCPDTALYSGWYALANYTPACKLNRGAVAWHLASYEAATLRDPKSRVWCVGLLRDGAAVTLGPVAEPYTVGFPKPEEFFGFLVTGEDTVVECYAKTALLVSWMTVFVGDPLYNPYAQTMPGKKGSVHPSPKGARNIFNTPTEDF